VLCRQRRWCASQTKSFRHGGLFCCHISPRSNSSNPAPWRWMTAPGIAAGESREASKEQRPKSGRCFYSSTSGTQPPPLPFCWNIGGCLLLASLPLLCGLHCVLRTRPEAPWLATMRCVLLFAQCPTGAGQPRWLASSSPRLMRMGRQSYPPHDWAGAASGVGHGQRARCQATLDRGCPAGGAEPLPCQARSWR
jgi:hypothetical protein